MSVESVVALLCVLLFASTLIFVLVENWIAASRARREEAAEWEAYRAECVEWDKTKDAKRASAVSRGKPQPLPPVPPPKRTYGG